MKREKPLKVYSKGEISAKIREGGVAENEAIEFLLKYIGGRVAQFVSRRGGSLEDAEDICMEGLTTVILDVKSGKFRGEAAITTYLVSVCKNMWLNKLRKLKREVYLKPDQTEIMDIELSMATVFVSDPENKDKLAHIATFLAHVLGENCKKIIMLDMEKYKTKEIVNMIDDYNNPASIDNKRAQCRSKLKRELSKNEEIRLWFQEISDQ